jgi:hypothetical protein
MKEMDDTQEVHAKEKDEVSNGFERKKCIRKDVFKAVRRNGRTKS